MNNDANMAPDDPSAARDSASLLRLHAVTLFVEDRGASVRFFVDALGFALLSGAGGPGEPSGSPSRRPTARPCSRSSSVPATCPRRTRRPSSC